MSYKVIVNPIFATIGSASGPEVDIRQLLRREGRLRLTAQRFGDSGNGNRCNCMLLELQMNEREAALQIVVYCIELKRVA